LFSKQFPTEDPTIYIILLQNIAKMMLEGWKTGFVMVNVPHNKSDSINIRAAIRKNVVDNQS
jgi:hypothetical protein